MPPDHNPLAELLTQRAEAASAQIQEVLAGLGPRTQGAILADLVSLWLAGHMDPSEFGKAEQPLTTAARDAVFGEWCDLVRELVPESEKQILQRVEPQGQG